MDYLRVLTTAVTIGVKATRIASELRDLAEELSSDESPE